MEALQIIKIGGNSMDDTEQLNNFLRDFSSLKEKKILVHGGGKLATEMGVILGISSQMVNGRRVTDEATLKIAVMVYAGYVNKMIVSRLQAEGCNAVGLSGADGNIIKSRKRQKGEIDFGFVGDIDYEAIQTELLEDLMGKGYVPIICAITHDKKGQLLNTNADTVVTKLAIALAKKFDTKLTYCFDKKGVLTEVADDTTIISKLNHSEYLHLLSNESISKGMIPKLENAFEALEQGIKSIKICHTENILKKDSLLIGTQII